MTDKFSQALERSQIDFGITLENDQIRKLADYYELIRKHNPLLHLVGPCTPEEFAVRHILESLTLLEFLPRNARFADVGTGAGLPSIPCLLVREDLQSVLIESKIKKADFLQEAVTSGDLENRALIINKQFEEVSSQNFSFVTCRALDKFAQKLPKLLRWSKGRSLLFFGGPGLREELIKNRVKFQSKLMPLSEQRYLFISLKSEV